MPRKAKKNVEPSEPSIPKKSDEAELTAASDAGLDRALDREAAARMRAISPASPSGEVEQLAEAADTFEQAYDDVSLAEALGTAPIASDVPGPMGVEIEELRDEEVEPGEEQAREAPPVHLERLQKILSQAGIASRRHAEAMITEGRVQVNGQVVTELGSKADPARDHIKVDGKLIHGAERLRYFVLNKPKGYVTTVSDPEGRPTVMQFFKKTGERLYPVGRLDYQSEGLLLVTNDGDLANKLTKAATGVEKTYLVKVSGQPTEEELERLRQGVGIDRSRPGEGRVQTAPAIIREARAGDNPWFEVVLTEGRNRELRKMFEEIGHHVEKIRRVGYGPLVLDVEPGQFRELEPAELAKLRLAAEGKWRKPKARQTEQRKQAPRREKRSSPVREDRRASGDAKGRTYKREDEQRTEGRKPRFERPAERRSEEFGRAEAPGRSTGRGGFTRRDEGASSTGVRRSAQRKPGEQGQKWNRESGAPRPYQRPFAGSRPKQGSEGRTGFAPEAGARQPERGGSRGPFSRPPKPGERTGRGKTGERPQRQDRGWQSRPRPSQFGEGEGAAGGNERGGSRGKFSRPAKPGEPRGRGQAAGQGQSRGWQAQRGPSRFGEGGGAERGTGRSESRPPQRRIGPSRGGRPASGPGKPASRGPSGGARGAGRRPSGRGPAGRGSGDRGRGR